MGTLMTHSPSKVCPPLNTTRPRDVGIADQRKAGKECKMLLFCAKTIEKESHNFELACLNKKKNNKRKEKRFCCLVTFWFGTFTMSFRSLVGHEKLEDE